MKRSVIRGDRKIETNSLGTICGRRRGTDEVVIKDFRRRDQKKHSYSIQRELVARAGEGTVQVGHPS